MPCRLRRPDRRGTWDAMAEGTQESECGRRTQWLSLCVPTFVPTRSQSGCDAYEHKKETLENQGFQVVGLVGLEPMTSTMSIVL